MSEALPYGLIYQQVTHLNTLLGLERKFDPNKREPYTGGVYIDQQSGQMILDIISVGSTWRLHEGERGIATYTIDNVILFHPFHVTYTADQTSSILTIVRKYVIDPKNAITEITAILDGYRKHASSNIELQSDYTDSSVGYSYLFYYNDLLEITPREVVMGIIAKRMVAKVPSRLKFTDNSFIIPSSSQDDNSAIDRISLEYNRLMTKHGWTVTYIVTASLIKGYEDVVSARHVGHRIDMAPINHNSVSLEDDHHLMVINNKDKPAILGEIYRDISESS